MPIENGSYTPLTFDEALQAIFSEAPASILFSPGNPPELVLANMFAQADVLLDENNGQMLAAFMSPVGAMIDLLNPNNPRRLAIAASGYVYVTNASATPVSIPANTNVTAASGIVYKTSTTFVIPGSSSAYIFVTCNETGIGGNIPSAQVFTVTGYSSLSGVNTLPFLNGAAAESDAIYINRLASERTEYGAQYGSVAVETEIKKYYADARMYVNNTPDALATPVPVPLNGYNLVVLTPDGVLSTAESVSQIFSILSERLEFVNAQSVGSDNHVVMSGTFYTSEIPLLYYFTVAQPVKTTLTATIDVRASSKADRTEIITQANEFAKAFIDRLVSLFSGINGTMSVTYHDGLAADVETAVAVAGSATLANSLAPAFGISTVSSLVCDIASIADTPQILFDSVYDMTMVIDPEVDGEASVTLSLGSGMTKFVNFKADALFTDGTSWFDRYLFIDPTNIELTVRVVEWI